MELDLEVVQEEAVAFLEIDVIRNLYEVLMFCKSIISL